MMKSKFLHVADVHLDSPLANLKRLDSATAERLQSASRRSLENIVALAISESVSAVVIAGDLFDGPVKDASAGIWVEGQLRRLVRAGIEVVLIRGNHDALSNAGKITNWPTGVTELPAHQPSTHVIESGGFAIHGQSFGARTELDDLAARYPEPVPGHFNIGVLHTSLSGSVSSGHDTYAPTSVETLENRGYEYWALGHIHVRSQASLSNSCYVGFSGNTQGRHVRETGAKGCNVVELRDGVLADVKFVPTDTFRWYELELDLSAVDQLGAIEDLAEKEIQPFLADSEGRPIAVRVNLTGSTELHSHLTKFGTKDQLSSTLGSRLKEQGDIWLEAVKVRTTPYFQQESGDELLLPMRYLTEASRSYQENSVLRKELGESIEELLRKTRHELAETGFGLATPERHEAELTRYVADAEQMLFARLTGGRDED